MFSPGDKFIDCANSAEKLYILVTHDVEHLGPQQQAHKHYHHQNYPSKLFHSTLRINILCHQIIMRFLNQD